MALPSLNKSKLRSSIVDVSILGGAALTTYGASLISAPAGFITLGLLLLALGINAARFR